MKKSRIALVFAIFMKVAVPVLVVGAVFSSAIVLNLVIAHKTKESGLVGSITQSRVITPFPTGKSISDLASTCERETVDPNFLDTLMWFMGNMWALVLGVMANVLTKRVDTSG